MAQAYAVPSQRVIDDHPAQVQSYISLPNAAKQTLEGALLEDVVHATGHGR